MTGLSPSALRRAVVICVATPRSASTWAYNAVLQILAKGGAPLGTFSDAWREELRASSEGRTLVLKMHHPDKSMRCLAKTRAAPAIMSVRDPRDSIASWMAQSGRPFEWAWQWYRTSAEAVLALDGVCQPLVLRYEDMDVVGRRGLEMIVSHLSAGLTAEQIAEIDRRLSPAAVRRHIQSLLDQGLLAQDDPARQWHPVTHWHPGHLGDGRTGKYADVLTPAQVALVTEGTRAFRTRFGYPD
jgi:hypothetical protein